MDKKEYFFQCWRQINKFKKRKYLELSKPEPYIFEPDEGNHLEFTLFSYCEDKPNLFLGACDGEDYYVEILECKTYEQLRSYVATFKSKENLRVNHLKRTYQITRLSSYVFIILTPQTPLVSIEEWLIFKDRIPKISISIDWIIKFAVNMLRIISRAQSEGSALQCVCPKNVYLSYENDVEEIIIDIINSDILKGQESIADVCGLGRCLKAMLEHENDCHKDEIKVPGLVELIDICMKGEDIRSFMKSKTFEMWVSLLKYDTGKVAVAFNNDLTGIMTGLFFDSERVSSKCVRMMQRLGIDDIREIIAEEEQAALKLLLKLSFQAISKSSAPFVLDFIVSLTQQCSKEKLRDFGIYRLMQNINKFDIKSETIKNSLMAAIHMLSSNNTLTMFYLGNNYEVLLEMIKENRDLLHLVPGIGPAAPNVVNLYSETGVFETKSEAVMYLIHTPVHFKMKSAGTVANILVNCLFDSYNDKLTVEKIKMFRYIMAIVYEIFIGGPRQLQSNISGTCTHEETLNCLPTVIQCDCGQLLCYICSREHAQIGHTFTYNLHNEDTPKKCTCKSIHTIPPVEIPYMEDSFEIELDFVGDEAENQGNSFQTGSWMNIYSRNLINVQKINTCFYYEVSVKNAGMTEGICVGIDCLQTSVKYDGKNGKIMVGENFYCKAPRFGTYDRVGVGITKDLVFFFTYNGYNLHIYVDTVILCEFTPLVSLEGEKIEVEIHLKNFMFWTTEPHIHEEGKDLLKQTIEKWSTNLLENNLADGDSADEAVRMVELSEKLTDFADLKLEKFRLEAYQKFNNRRQKDSCLVF